MIAPAIAVADELNVLYECNLGLHPKKIEEGKSIRAALIECKKFFEGEIKKLNWQMSFVESNRLLLSRMPPTALWKQSL